MTPDRHFILRFLGLTVRKILGGVMQPWRIYLDATPGIYRNHVARCQQRIPTVPDIYTPWRPMQHSGNLINKPVAD